MVLCVDTTIVLKNSPFITRQRVQDNVNVIVCCLFHPSFVALCRCAFSRLCKNGETAANELLPQYVTGAVLVKLLGCWPNHVSFLRKVWFTLPLQFPLHDSGKPLRGPNRPRYARRSYLTRKKGLLDECSWKVGTARCPAQGEFSGHFCCEMAASEPCIWKVRKQTTKSCALAPTRNMMAHTEGRRQKNMKQKKKKQKAMAVFRLT